MSSSTTFGLLARHCGNRLAAVGRRDHTRSRVLEHQAEQLSDVFRDDTGPGIPADAVGRIFEDFEFGTAAAERAGGSGLGLSVSRRLARLMGGDVTVVSEVGVGSRFELVVPARAIDAEPATATREAEGWR